MARAPKKKPAKKKAVAPEPEKQPAAAAPAKDGTAETADAEALLRALGIEPPAETDFDPHTVYGPPIAPRLGSIARSPEKGKRGASKKPAFLAAYIATAGNITRAAAAAGIHRSLHHVWLKEDADYRRAFAEADEQATSVLEDEGRRRAFEGCWDPVLYKGRIAAWKLNYSDAIWLAMMRTKKPREYSQVLQHKGSGDKGEIQLQVQVADETLAKLTDDQLQSGISDLRRAQERIREMLARAGEPGGGDLPPAA